MKSYMEDDIWTVREAADYLKISEYSLREICRNKRIPHFRVGERLIRFSKDELIKWKARQENRNYR